MSVAVAELPARRLMSRATAWLATTALATLCVTSALVVLSAVGTHDYLVPVERRGVRGWIDGPLGGLGVHVTVSQFGLELAVMAIAYLAAMFLADRLTGRQIALAVATTYATFVVAPPLLSTDVFSYIAYARLGVVHHHNPYEFSPSAAPQDVIYHFVHWRHRRSSYGPLFTLPSYALGYVSPTVALWVLKVTAGVAGLGCVALVARAARRLGHSPRLAAVVFGLNPVMLIWAVGGAHNDLLMLVAFLGGVALVVEKREALGGAALVTALAIKATAGLALPFALLGARRRSWAVLGMAGAGLLSFAVAYVGFPDHAVGLVSVLGNQPHLLTPENVPQALVNLVGLQLTSGVRLLLDVLLAGALLGLVIHVRRGGDWIRAVGWAFVALLVTSTWITPWYLIWPLPLAAISRDRRLLAITLMLQCYLIVYDLATFA
ncbi:MAG: alpha,6-mannosyltransferase [Solirubrobacteraceae bacterium]|nr:alpha,6-mannosyltransferase [Solirubrobacteraceae bacterium]